MKQGKLIVLEGIDGVGKTTQARMLLKHLRGSGYSCELISFPQYSRNVFGRLIRSLLDGRHGNPTAADPYLMASVYAADRFESKETLAQWLRKGKVVICDRYVSANMIHQGGKIKNLRERTRFFTWLETVEHRTFCLPRPDMVVYLSLSPKLASSLLSTKDRVERSRAYNRNSFTVGRHLAKTKKWRVVSCEKDGRVRTREAIHQEIYRAVMNFIAP